MTVMSSDYEDDYDHSPPMGGKINVNRGLLAQLQSAAAGGFDDFNEVPTITAPTFQRRDSFEREMDRVERVVTKIDTQNIFQPIKLVPVPEQDAIAPAEQKKSTAPVIVSILDIIIFMVIIDVFIRLLHSARRFLMGCPAKLITFRQCRRSRRCDISRN